MIGLNQGQYNFSIKPLSLPHYQHITQSISLFLYLLHSLMLGHLIEQVNLVLLLLFK